MMTQDPDTNTGTATPTPTALATATAVATADDMGPEPAEDGYHGRIFDLSTPYRGASRVIVSRLSDGGTIVVGLEPGETDAEDIRRWIQPLANLGRTESLVGALADMGYAAS